MDSKKITNAVILFVSFLIAAGVFYWLLGFLSFLFSDAIRSVLSLLLALVVGFIIYSRRNKK